MHICLLSKIFFAVSHIIRIFARHMLSRTDLKHKAKYTQ